MVHPDDMAKVFKTLGEHLKGNTAQYYCRNRLKMKSGAYRRNVDIGQVIERNEQDEPIRMVGHDRGVAA
jgi:hypothetical protein|tara:strand:+ start:4157 stop:4363 length:207 start_codon:yes stop_codon:yes gene_type:complete